MGERKSYVRISDRIAENGYETVEPFDSTILRMLPDEGTLFAGLYPLGETVSNITKKLNHGKPRGEHVSAGSVSSRLRSLSFQGLCVNAKSTPGTNGNNVWQKTEAAKTYLAKQTEGAK